MSRRLVPLIALLCLSGLSPACSTDPLTQIVVVVDSDWNGFDHLEIAVAGFEHPATVKASLAEEGFPRRVVLVHDGGPLGPLSVTVRGFVAHRSDPVLIEPRTGIFFVAGQTRMLTVHLFFDCTGPVCPADEACVQGPKCVSSASVSRLARWTGDVHALSATRHVDAGDVLGTDALDGAVVAAAGREGGSPSDAQTGADAGDAPAAMDATMLVDSGSAPPVVAFAYSPANFDATASNLGALDPVKVTLDCGTSELDSTELRFTNWCGKAPTPTVVSQLDGSTDAVVLVMSSLEIAAGSTLQLSGTRPVILAVFGDARIDGTLDASAHGAVAGPGADRSCGGSTGSSAPSGLSGTSAGGGSGGGFGSAGGAGGANGTGMGVSGGTVGGTAALTPLRGGCSGGRGGVVGTSAAAAAAGGGGGAVQISVASEMMIAGHVLAGGGGGRVGSAQDLGGAGGGSGGAILLEAARLSIDASAVIAANGGAGGGGQLRGFGVTNAKPGEDGLAGVMAAAGGAASGSAGPGGAGAAATSEALSGQAGSIGGGGGGGGGGAGRIRVNQASSCTLAGTLSPLPSVSCTSCAASCPPPSVLGCQTLDRGGRVYYRCDTAATWQNALANCQTAGTQLVKIDDSAENAWVRSQVTQETWLGASDAAQEGSWLWAQDGSQFWMGSGNGAVVGGAFAAWSTGEPNGYSSTLTSADCATLQTDGQWRDQSCDATYPYVCE